MYALEEEVCEIGEGMNRQSDMATLEFPWVGGTTGGENIKKSESL